MPGCQDQIRRFVPHIPEISLIISLICSIVIFPAGALQAGGAPVITPGETLVVGDEVSVYVEVIYSVSSMSEYMDLSTGLSDARWEVDIMSDGQTVGEVRRTGRYVGITGFELFNTGFTKLLVHLNGTVSEGFYGPGEQTLMSIDHIAADGSTVLGTVEVTARVLTVAEVNALRETTGSDLEHLGGLISAAYADGMDAAAAQEAHADAQDLIAASATLPPAEAFAALTSAGDMIADATSGLSEQMYLQIVASANAAVYRTEELMAEYEEAPGYSKEGAMVVLSRLESARTLLVLAQEKKNSGDRLSALSYAQEARSKAEGSWEYLVYLTGEAGRGTTPPQTSIPEDIAGKTPFIIDPGMTASPGSDDVGLSGITDILNILWSGISGGVEFIRQLTDAVNRVIG